MTGNEIAKSNMVVLINSILAFTVERFIAVCHPLLARKLCTVERTRRVVCAAWIGTIVYCGPWLGLTEVKEDEFNPDHMQCRFRLSRDIYLIFFLADIVVFYVAPLLVAVCVYMKIWRIVIQRTNFFRRQGSTHWLQQPAAGSDSADSPVAYEMKRTFSVEQEQTTYVRTKPQEECAQVRLLRSKVPVSLEKGKDYTADWLLSCPEINKSRSVARLYESTISTPSITNQKCVTIIKMRQLERSKLTVKVQPTN